MSLSPEARALLGKTYRSGAPRLHMLSIEQARASFSRLLDKFTLPAPEIGAVTDIVMPRSDAPALLARMYRPPSIEPDTTLPVLLWFHGGGWCLGDVDSYDPLCRRLTHLTGCAVIAVEYRLAPEAPFPAAVEDARFAFDWIVDQSGILNIDPASIALAGDSAGATLSLVTAVDLDKTRTPFPVLLILIYPSADAHGMRASRQAYANGYFLDADTLHWFFNHYVPEGNTGDWRVSPLYAPSLSGLPPVVMITAEYDPLLDECIALRDRIQAEGGVVEYHCAPGMIHGFLTLGGLFPEAGATLEQIARKVRHYLRHNLIPPDAAVLSATDHSPHTRQPSSPSD